MPESGQTCRDGKKLRKNEEAEHSEDTGTGGHICLIIGYNNSTGEIAISDSWGPRFAERWVPAPAAQKVTNQYDSMNVIKW